MEDSQKNRLMRYVVEYDGGCDRLIIDTHNTGYQNVVCYNVNLDWANRICKLLNEEEGEWYGN